MKIIDLPVVSTSTGIIEALEQMARGGRTAALIETPSGYSILQAHTAMEALRQAQPRPTRTLANITTKDTVPVVGGVALPAARNRIGAKELSLMSTALMRRGVSRGVLGIQGSTAWLALDDNEARHLGYQIIFCTCPSDPDEVYQPYEAPDRICPNHGVPLNCR
jgi:hypothetical protein